MRSRGRGRSSRGTISADLGGRGTGSDQGRDRGSIAAKGRGGRNRSRHIGFRKCPMTPRRHRAHSDSTWIPQSESTINSLGNFCKVTSLAAGLYIHHEFIHYGVIKWKHFPRYWPFLRGIHRSPVNSPHKGQWRGTLMFFFYLHLNKRLSKQPKCRWFETQSRSLWRHCNVETGWCIYAPLSCYYLTQWWLVINWTHGNKCLWLLNQNTTIFNTFESVICKMVMVLFCPKFVKTLPCYRCHKN